MYRGTPESSSAAEKPRKNEKAAEISADFFIIRVSFAILKMLLQNIGRGLCSALNESTPYFMAYPRKGMRHMSVRAS